MFTHKERSLRIYSHVSRWWWYHQIEEGMAGLQQQIDEADPAALAFLRGNSAVVAGALEEVRGASSDGANKEDDGQRPGSAGAA